MIEASVRNPSPLHEDRRRSLDAVAVLSGHTEWWPSFPDGLLPDVLRYDPRTDHLFVGDAKATETPGCTATMTRLLAYARWVRAHVSRRARSGTLAVAYGKADQTNGWMRLLTEIALELDLTPSAHAVVLSTGLRLVYANIRTDKRARIPACRR